jgi:peptide/nickel transport system substrate-binding protein
MSGNYWERFTSTRNSRRRVLKVGAGGFAAAAFIAACGGDDEDGAVTANPTAAGGTVGSTAAETPTVAATGSSGGQTGASSGLLANPKDTSQNAVRGGTFRDSTASDGAWAYDINLNPSGLHLVAGFVYSRLVKYTIGTRDGLPDGTVEGDFADSYETSPDGLSVTFKLRPDLKFDTRPPTNGRVATSEDVKFSWDRWVAGHAKGGDLSAERNPDAPVLSLSTPDATTVVMNLAYPFAPLLPELGFAFYPVIMPTEADGGFDPRSTARGTGAWVVEKHEPSSSVLLARNENWYDKDRPYFDEWQITVIGEYATGLAQFAAGNLDIYPVLQQDILATKQDHPELVLVQDPVFTKNTGGWIYFDRRPDSPFNDDRVRRAMSMEIDRDLWLDTFSNRKFFESAGLPVETAWTNFVGPGFSFHLDPQGSEIGEGGKNFIYNPEEAKKLLAAAGHSSPIDVPWNTTTLGGPSALEAPEAMRAGIASHGDFTLEPVRVLTYATEFIPQVQSKRGAFDGVAYQPYAEPPDYDFTMYTNHHPKGPNYWMQEEDPEITRFVEAQRRELDAERRADIFKDFQRYAATKMHYIPAPPGDWKDFSLAQPRLANFGAFVPWIAGVANSIAAQELYTHWWADESKR